MPRIGRRVFKVWRRNLDSYRRFYLVSLVGSLGDPLLFLVALGFGLGAFLGEIDGTPYVRFIAPGLIMSSAMFASAFECTYGSFLRMMYQKTYDAIIATPVEIEEVIAGDILWGATKALISGGIVALVVVALGLVDSPAFVLAPILIFLVGLLFASLAMLATSIVPNFESFNYFFQLFLAPMFFFSGVFFPLDTLPAPVQTIAHVLPLTHAVSLSRALGAGRFELPLLFDLIFLIGIALASFLGSVKLTQRRLLVRP